MTTRNQDSEFQVGRFEGFSVVRVPGPELAAAQIQFCLKSLQELATSGETLVFLDFGNASPMAAGLLSELVAGVADFKSKCAMEIVILSEPALDTQLQSSPLTQLTRFYDRRDNGERLQINKKLLDQSETELSDRLWAAMDDAIQLSLERWIGKLPAKAGPAVVKINPGTDIVSRVEMNVDGHLFHVFLSAEQTTLRAMLTQILKTEIAASDPAISDGACELLNYLSAYFRQLLVNAESVVEINAPHLLVPEEMMSVLGTDLPTQRVETPFGTFDVWLARPL